MEIQCQRCHVAIPATDVNVERMVAKCGACNAVFSFDEQLKGGEIRRAPTRAPVPLPEGWVLAEGEAAPFGGAGYRRPNAALAPELTLTWRWFKITHVFTLVFSLFWCGFLAVWYAGATAGAAPFFVFVFPIIHVAVGVGLFYASMAGLLNRTTLSIRDQVLTVAHAPLPWLGGRMLPVEEIRQLYCVENKHRNKSSITYSYTVKVQRKSGDELTLVKRLHNAGQALFLEYKVEHALGIDDVPIVGELAK